MFLSLLHMSADNPSSANTLVLRRQSILDGLLWVTVAQAMAQRHGVLSSICARVSIRKEGGQDYLLVSGKYDDDDDAEGCGVSYGTFDGDEPPPPALDEDGGLADIWQ
jgi:hypothetical protein